jgi:hypothetical protein
MSLLAKTQAIENVLSCKSFMANDSILVPLGYAVHFSLHSIPHNITGRTAFLHISRSSITLSHIFAFTSFKTKIYSQKYTVLAEYAARLFSLNFRTF